MAEGVSMKFSQLTFIVTDDCNYNCAYCPQMKEKKYMKPSTIEKAIAFFYPFLNEETSISFYGGEPLLAFDKIKYAVSLLLEKNKAGEKKLVFYLTTNGSLVTDETLDFFDGHHFDVLLSFDGLVQDIARKPGSLVPTRELIKRIQKSAYPGIEFSTYSVFTPGTVNQLSASLQYIIECGLTTAEFSLAVNMPWGKASLMTLERELSGLCEFLVSYYKEKGSIPVRNFRGKIPPPKTGNTFACTAGLRQMAITPGENVWGCLVFHSYFKNRKGDPDFSSYSFGKLDDFIKNHQTLYPRILTNFAFLRQHCFFTENQYCFLCDDVNICQICPVSEAHVTSVIGRISPWVCRIKKIQRQQKKNFMEAVGNISL